MEPRDKYTVYSKWDRGYRKGIHKMPKFTRVRISRLAMIQATEYESIDHSTREPEGFLDCLYLPLLSFVSVYTTNSALCHPCASPSLRHEVLNCSRMRTLGPNAPAKEAPADKDPSAPPAFSNGMSRSPSATPPSTTKQTVSSRLPCTPVSPNCADVHRLTPRPFVLYC